jgi:flagellar basal-body rod protein FlgB
MRPADFAACEGQIRPPPVPEPEAMLGDLPLIATLKARMQYHQARQKVLAENVANADSPGFRPRDMAPFEQASRDLRRGGGVQPVRTDARHIGFDGGGAAAQASRRRSVETTPSGNSVSLEDEMMRMAQNQSDYHLATALYGKSLAYLRTALGRRG